MAFSLNKRVQFNDRQAAFLLRQLGLIQRGHSDEVIRRVIDDNVLRVLGARKNGVRSNRSKAVMA